MIEDHAVEGAIYAIIHVVHEALKHKTMLNISDWLKNKREKQNALTTVTIGAGVTKAMFLQPFLCYFAFNLHRNRKKGS